METKLLDNPKTKSQKVSQFRSLLAGLLESPHIVIVSCHRPSSGQNQSSRGDDGWIDLHQRD